VLAKLFNKKGMVSMINSNQFEGWYFKHQASGKSLAIIPGKSRDSAFILVITDSNSYHIPYPLKDYHKSENHQAFHLRIGDSIFTHTGIVLSINHPSLTLSGEIAYTNFTPIKNDIMGLFRFFPMECRHGIVSMNHNLKGSVILNGEQLDFTGGKGYIESDSGRSFPKWYTWVQCNAFDSEVSIMASIARIPFYGLRFWGCICVVWLNGREYRLATYKGVKIVHCEQGIIELKQGKYRLTIFVDKHDGYALPAPQSGIMSRFIRETLAIPARFRFMEGDCCLFDGASDYASYEYMMQE